jgi:hypothetical protein
MMATRPSRKVRRSRVRVVVVGDVAHVVVDRPRCRVELLVGDGAQDLVQVRLDVLGGLGVVHAPHDHGHETYLAVTDPTDVVFEVALRHDRGFTQFAGAHWTSRVTVDL